MRHEANEANKAIQVNEENDENEATEAYEVNSVNEAKQANETNDAYEVNKANKAIDVYKAIGENIANEAYWAKKAELHLSHASIKGPWSTCSSLRYYLRRPLLHQRVDVGHGLCVLDRGCRLLTVQLPDVLHPLVHLHGVPNSTSQKGFQLLAMLHG